jgi:hypothetical protein
MPDFKSKDAMPRITVIWKPRGEANRYARMEMHGHIIWGTWQIWGSLASRTSFSRPNGGGERLFLSTVNTGNGKHGVREIVDISV